MMSHNMVIIYIELYKVAVSKLLYMYTFSHTLYIILTVLLFSVMKEIFTNLYILSISVYLCTTTIDVKITESRLSFFLFSYSYFIFLFLELGIRISDDITQAHQMIW